ncbi:MAG: sporulation protein YabP [Christensenellaceae bacterium]|nr:sporulation protein YabP [Christensenellaceae bacterium]
MMGTHEETRQLRGRAHMISLDNRERASFSGVTDLESFNDEEVVMVTELGVIVLAGQELHISKLNLEDGQLVVEGRVDAVEYIDGNKPQRRGLFGKILK